MMRLFTLITLCFLTFSSFGQNNPIFSKVTATWCPNCGTWGWDYMEAMKAEFATGPGVPLGVHFSGDLQNPTAVWFANNLNSSGQPRFFVNNTNISAAPSTWANQVTTAKDMTDEIVNSSPDIIGFDGVGIDNGIINATINLTALPDNATETYVALYIYENNVENNQSALGIAMHPNVLRSAMGTNATDVDFDGYVANAAGNFEFLGTIDPSWNEAEIGLLAVVYDKVGNTYEIKNSQSISNINLVLDTEELLPQDIFTFKDAADNLEILVNNNADYQLTLHNMNGQTLMTKQFNNSVIINKTNLTTGMYIAHFRSGNAVLSQQIFIR